MPLNRDNPQPETTNNNITFNTSTRSSSFTERRTNTPKSNEPDPFLQHLGELIQEINDSDTRRIIQTEIIKYVKGMKQKNRGFSFGF